MEKEYYNFNVEQVTNECIQWIKDWFEKNGPGCNAVLGLSGGKDSTIVAALCAKALGPDRVIGVAMPDNRQGINEADKIAEHLGIKFLVLPIGYICSSFDVASDNYIDWSVQTKQNIPPRIRMTMLYAVSQTFNGRVVGTCNTSENYIGYMTRWGDQASDFEPIGNLTVTEVLQIGDYLGLPYEWVHKVPDDGLPHSLPDEEKFGFSYTELDRYIREGVEPEGKCNNSDELKIDKIKRMHTKNEFKLKPVQFFTPTIP